MKYKTAQTLNNVRQELKKLNDYYGGLEVVDDSMRPWRRDMDNKYIGRMIEAIDVAENAVFNVLSTASAFLNDPVAEAATNKWL